MPDSRAGVNASREAFIQQCVFDTAVYEARIHLNIFRILLAALQRELGESHAAV